MIKKFFVFIIIMLSIAFPVSAENNDIYSKQYENSNVEEIENSLPDDVRNFLEKNGLNPSDYNWTKTLTPQNVFKHILSFLKNGMKAPIKVGGAMLGIVLITAAITSFVKENGAMNAAIYASVISVCAVIISPVLSCVSAGVNALKGSSVFMLSFIPVFAGIVATSGAVVTGSVMSGILLLVSQGVSYISSFVITPMMGGYLAVSVSSSISPLINQSGISEGIKKIAMWVLSLVSTVFLGVLGLQTTISSSADSLTLRTAKFILGSAVPVAGTAVSEAFSTVSASMGLLKSSIGIYGVVALVVIFLPIIIELVIWRFIILINNIASDIFSLDKISAILKAVDMMLSLLIGIILTVGVVFIISLTVVIGVGKS